MCVCVCVCVCLCVCLLGDVVENEWENGRRMIKRGENRFWKAFCQLQMHTIT